MAAGLAATFAMCSLLYAPSATFNYSTDTSISPPTGIANATYSAQLLTHAKDAYSFAVNSSNLTTYSES
jgi:hypothetical protein